MKIEEAIEILQAHNEWRRNTGIPNSKAMVNPIELGKALDKAIEVMRESLECQHPYSFVHSRCFGEINQCLLCGEEL